MRRRRLLDTIRNRRSQSPVSKPNRAVRHHDRNPATAHCPTSGVKRFGIGVHSRSRKRDAIALGDLRRSLNRITITRGVTTEKSTNAGADSGTNGSS
ncbi:MAG: hypothetical protein ABII82_16935 [Verrucomicrobiota bacterium]